MPKLIQNPTTSSATMNSITTLRGTGASDVSILAVHTSLESSDGTQHEEQTSKIPVPNLQPSTQHPAISRLTSAGDKKVMSAVMPNRVLDVPQLMAPTVDPLTFHKKEVPKPDDLAPTHSPQTKIDGFSAALWGGTASKLQLFKFWALLTFGLATFLGWLALFSWLANIYTPNAAVESYLGSRIDDETKHKDSASISLAYVDVWFALAVMAAMDAFAVVLNFNRSLIHQFHYFVSLRITTFSFVVASVVRLVHPISSVSFWYLGTVLFASALTYVAIYAIIEYIHRFLPVRGIGMSPGSLDEFSDQIARYDVSWPRALLYAAVNGGVGLLLTTLIPAEFSLLNPVVHITWEVTFLGLMGTKQTPRYILFATPLVQASTCTDWGLRQIVAVPSNVLSPIVFVSLLLVSRLVLDIHLRTVFSSRPDFQWARANALLSTPALILASLCLLVLEYLGLPLITYFKPLSVLTFHTFGVLVFLLPASYALAFNKIQQIRL